LHCWLLSNLSFSEKAKKPYGSYVLRDLLKSVNPEKKIISIHDGLFQYNINNKKTEKSIFVFITKSFSPDKIELEELLLLAENGNEIFICADKFSENIIDTLNFKVEYKWEKYLDTNKLTSLYIGDYVLHNDSGFKVDNNFAEFHIKSFDTLTTKALGADADTNTNFIKIKFGLGNIYINTNPLLFTNYNILYGNYKYVFTALSYPQGNTIIWDEYFKPNKSAASSPLRYILSQPALKAAYFLILITVFLYLIFERKRRQRIIPEIKPPKNMSLEFADTLGRLYFKSGNNRDIALKKFSYFCDFLRNKFYIKTFSDDAEFFKFVAERTGTEEENINNIFKYINVLKSQSWTSDKDLIWFNLEIEKFYNKTK